MVVPENAVETILIVPPGMKGLEYVDQLGLVKTVETGYDGVKLMDHVLLLVERNRPVFDADCLRPSNETVVGAGKATGEGYDPPPHWGVTLWTWDRKRVENKEIEVRLDESTCIPVERNRRENAQCERLILFLNGDRA